MRQIPMMVSFGVTQMALGLGARIAAAQCSMCRTGLLNSPEGQQLVAGFNSGILFLLAVPLVIFCSALFFFWRASRKRLQHLDSHRNPLWKGSPTLSVAPVPENKFASPAKLSETL